MKVPISDHSLSYGVPISCQRLGPSLTKEYPIGLGPGGNEQVQLCESTGSISTGSPVQLY
jgi:hypothetical protein